MNNYAEYVVEEFEKNNAYNVNNEADMKEVRIVLNNAGYRFKMNIEERAFGHKIYHFKKLAN